MRSDEGAAGIDCDDELTQLACEMGSDECPAACRDNGEENEDEDGVVKSGSLVVSSSAADDRSVVVPTYEIGQVKTAVSDLDTLTFKTSEEVTLSKVVLEKYGFSNTDDIVNNVWLEDEDGNEITTKAKPNTKGLVNLTVKKDYKVVDGTLNATIVVETIADIDHQKAPSGTLGFKVNDVNSTAKDVDLGNYKAYKYDVVAYDGASAKVSARGGSKDYNWEASESYEVSKFKIKAPDASAIVLKSFVLENVVVDGKTLDTHEFLDADSVEVSVAGKTVKATASINKDEELTISLKDEVELAAKENVEFVVSAKLNSDFDEYGKYIQFRVKSITANDKNNARINITTTGADWLKYTFNGGKLKFTSNKLGKIEASINSNDVLIADGTVTVGESVEGTAYITINQTQFNKTLDGVAKNGLWPYDAIEEIRLVVAGDETPGTILAKKHDGVTPNSKDSASFEVAFQNLDLSQSGKVRVYVDIIEDKYYQGETISFSSIEWDLKYSDAANGSKAVTDKAGSISVSNLTLTEAQGSLTNSVSDDVEYNNKEVNTYTIFDGVYTAKKNDVYLNEFTVTPVYDGAAADAAAWKANILSKVTFYLSIDGDEVADKVLECNAGGTECKATETFKDTLVKAGESAKIKLEAEVDAKENLGGANSLTLGKFKLEVSGVDENDNDAGSADKKSATVKIVSKGSVKVNTDNVKDTVLRKAADAKIAEFRVKPDGANSTTLEDISFSIKFVGADYDGDVNLFVDDKSETLSGQPTGTDVYVDGTARTLSASLNTNVDSEGVVVRIELDSEYAGKVEVRALNVNDNPQTKEFNKRFETAVVSINSQKDDGTTTTFYFGVDKKSSDSVQNIQLFINNKWIDVKNLKDVSDGDSYGILGDTEASHYVEGIRYTINKATFTYACSDNASTTKAACDTAGKTWQLYACANGIDTTRAACIADTASHTASTWNAVTDNSYITIEKSDYDDFFKLGSSDDYAMLKLQKTN